MGVELILKLGGLKFLDLVIADELDLFVLTFQYDKAKSLVKKKKKVMDCRRLYLRSQSSVKLAKWKISVKPVLGILNWT